MAEPPFAGVQRDLHCGELGLLDHEATCVTIVVSDNELPDMSAIADHVSRVTDTPPDHIVCSKLALRGEFNCAFFGVLEDDEYPVLLVYGRDLTGAPEIMLALTVSTLGPEQLRHYVSG